MLNKKILIVGISTLSLLLGGCNSETVTQEPGLSKYEVSKEKWNELFNLENVALHSNYKISVVVPQNEWESSLSFDNGKMYITGVGLSGVPLGGEPVEQKDYKYVVVKGITNGMMTYDDYVYWNGWTVEEDESEIKSFFLSYGIFALDFNDFVYNEENKEYFKNSNTNSEDTTDTILNGTEVHINFLNNRIEKIEYIKRNLDEVMEISYTFSDYGRVSFDIPEVK
ncbi:MAG: hypothetical protein K5765_06200 [Clostridia bacterium]|nr:hypothetical protein [Clostridia bacterium]